MTHFCANCWKEIDPDSPVCPNCGTDQSVLNKASFVEKLIHALGHPEPETPMRAAWILGQLKSDAAVIPLIALARSSNDVFIRAAALNALIAIGSKNAIRFIDSLNRTTLTSLEQHALDKLRRQPA